MQSGMSERRDAAMTILNQLLELRQQRYVPEFDVARLYLGLGENDLAFEWLERNERER
jgi:hypothetical protein